MKNISIMLLMAALVQSAICRADYVPTSMPQGTPPPISNQTKQLIQGQLQTAPKLPAISASAAAAPTATALPQNLPTAMYHVGNASADNFDNQHAYQDQIKQYIQTQKR